MTTQFRDSVHTEVRKDMAVTVSMAKIGEQIFTFNARTQNQQNTSWFAVNHDDMSLGERGYSRGG